MRHPCCNIKLTNLSRQAFIESLMTSICDNIKGWHTLLLVLIFVLSSTSSLAADGYQNTKLWWNSVQEQAEKYSLYLQALYAEQQTKVKEADHVETEFCHNLCSLYPGSECSAENLSGTIQLTPNTRIVFDNISQIVSIRHQDQDITYQYFLEKENDSVVNYSIQQGRGKISLVLNPEDYSQSYFGPSSLLREIYVGAPVLDVTDSLEDVYRDYYSKSSMSMNEFSQKAIIDREFRRQILNEDFIESIRATNRTVFFVEVILLATYVAIAIITIMMLFNIGPIRWERKKKGKLNK